VSENGKKKWYIHQIPQFSGNTVLKIDNMETGSFPVFGNEFQVTLPTCCYLSCCTDINYDITDSQGKSVGTITKQWKGGGCIETVYTIAGVTWVIDLTANLSNSQKYSIISATMLLDYGFYKQNRKDFK